MPTAFFLTRLKVGVKAEDYERFLREHDYPLSATVPSIKSYRVYRIKEALKGSALCQYLEVVEIADKEQYLNDLNQPHVQALLKDLTGYLDEDYTFLLAKYVEP